MPQQLESIMPGTARFSRRATWAGGESIVNSLMARTLAHPNLVSLAAGFVDQQTLPIDAAEQAFAAIAARPERIRAALQYGTTVGYSPLRELIVERLMAADADPTRQVGEIRERTILTAGSNELLYLVSDCLVDPGDIVLCPSPTYFVYLGTLANLGARAVGVTADEKGLVPEAVDEQLAHYQRAGELDRVKAIYVPSYYDNPRGVNLSVDRRAALVEIARRWSTRGRIYLIEDVAYRELRYGDEDLPSLWSFDPEGDTVIHAGTFSKSFSPGIRVGWGVLPQALFPAVLSAKGHLDFGSPNLNQHLMAEIIESGRYDEHVAMLRGLYRTKLDAMLRAADEHFRPIEGLRWNEPTGGLYLWLELARGLDAGMLGPLFDRAVAEGMFYIPGEPCYPAEGEAVRPDVLRLSFGIPSCEAIVEGVAALGRAIQGLGSKG